MAAGIPAKVIGYVEEQVPSLTMKHGMLLMNILHKLNFVRFDERHC